MQVQRVKMFVAAAIMCWTLVGRAAGAELTEPEKIAFFERDVQPLLQAHCVKCHGGEAKIKGNLRLTSRAGVLKGGDLGPVVSLESPEKSLLLEAVNYTRDDLRMPPKQKLSAGEIAVFEKWAKLGLPWTPGEEPAVAEAPAAASHGPPKPEDPKSRAFWSFQPVKRPAVPTVEGKWGRNPIDAFILAKLEAKHLSPVAPAGKVALLRRAYFDLTGLPPTPAEVDAFLNDASPDAYEKIVDRLLASPRYGEKWGRHWLDLVRFAETNSFERDGVKPFAWRYRDYVIDAFNQDKPYDQFIREQIAGDELDQPTPETITATGYYRLGVFDDEPADRLQARYDELDDIVATTGQVFLGVTVNCARCHDHKLDPIPQRDYYRLLAFFQDVKPYSNDMKSILATVAADADKAVWQKEHDARMRRRDELRDLIKSIEDLAVGRADREERVKITGPDRDLELLRQRIGHDFGEEKLKQFDSSREELERLREEERDPPLPKALAVKEAGSRPGPTHILIRGSAHAEGDEVKPGFPTVLGAPDPRIPEPSTDAKSSGRRRLLADWLASPSNPLTARVIVNRIWQHHFGRGIVKSTSDFGFTGDAPTHPELLDWLASELVSGGWRMKAIHRLIMTSEAYRMGSTADAAGMKADPGNELFWRFDMRRLEAEELRDSILAVSGELNLKMGGPGVYPTIPQAVLAGQSVPGQGWGKSSPEEQARRSVYVHVKRSLALPILSGFDAAETDFSCPVRLTTTQSTQALSLLNSDFLAEQSKTLAKRLVREAGPAAAEQVKHGLRLALSREPTQKEIDRGVAFMDRLQNESKLPPQTSLEQFSLLLLNLNEFVYLD